MISEERRTQLSDFPKCEPGKPEIFFERVGSYPCFCINDIYLELFAGSKKKAGASVDSARICFPRNPHIIKKGKELLAFLLPPSLFERIESTTKDEKKYVKDYDYKEFFLKSTNNNKITRLLFSMFSTLERDSEKSFIESIQTHFIQILKVASFQQPQLKSFLCSLVDNSIAPLKHSPAANKAFHTLIDSEEHDATSKAIANVFISAMLGLYSMKYNASVEKTLGYDRKRDYLFIRTYLLNKVGMEFIWTPEIISKNYVKLQDVLYSYECGLYEKAYARALTWLAECGNTARNQELASAHYILGACLYLYPECCNPGNLTKENFNKLKSYLPNELLKEDNSAAKSNEVKEMMCSEGIALLEKCVSMDDSLSEAFFILYSHYDGKNEQKALECLFVAFAQTYVKAVIEVANHSVKGKKKLPELTDDDVIDKLTAIISNEQNYSGIDVSECLYLRGPTPFKT